MKKYIIKYSNSPMEPSITFDTFSYRWVAELVCSILNLVYPGKTFWVY